MKRALLVEYLCNCQPLPIRTRLLNNEAFAARFGVRPRTIMTVGGVASVDQRDLFLAARRTLAAEGEQRIADQDGREIVVVAEQGAVILKRTPEAGQPVEARLNTLMILSPRRGDRTVALDRMLGRLGPTAPDFSALREAAEQRELEDCEIAELLAEATNGLAARQARAARAIKANQATIEDLVPDSLDYFERFCGPGPGEVTPEEYLTVILPAYRKKLLSRDLTRGLDICLLGALRDDLTPASWTEHLSVSDDDLWNSLVACNPHCDPFSLLGALDVALSRQHDDRYRSFAEEAVTKLSQEEFSRPDGIDAYELLPLFAELVLDRLSTLEGGAVRSPHWKRMCAWMQAGLLLRLTLPIQLDLERLRDWTQANRTPASSYSRILDLRREPMYRASEMSRAALRDEVVGRLLTLRPRHEKAGRLMPRSGEIEQAVVRLADRGRPLGWAMPGPLEGHRRPADFGQRRLPEGEVKKIGQELLKDPCGPVWSALASFSQCFDLGAELMAQAREASALMDLNRDAADRGGCLRRLPDACLVAAAQRDVDLARSIAAKVLARAPETCSHEEAIAILQVVLIAGAAFEAQHAWAVWLEEQLAGIAAGLPAGEASKAFLDHLTELKKILPLTFSIQSRAEALASAAS